MRKTKFVNGEFYHIYNRGVDKRTIFNEKVDIERFLDSMKQFNRLETIGSIYENKYRDKLGSSAPKSDKLVNFISFCLNPNHFHFLLEQVSDNGIQKFMHKLSTGYTNYYNEKRSRVGALFQGRYKAIHVDDNGYLLHLSAYINLNFRVHKINLNRAHAVSSWNEYVEREGGGEKICSSSVVLDQFNIKDDYRLFAERSLEDILQRRNTDEEMKTILIE